MKTFLICPVRGVDPALTEGLVKDLEADGWDVHWPPRDTDQNDNTGLHICQDNKKAIQEADVIHLVWDGKSQGSLFDLGMAFMLGKEIYPLNIPKLTEGKSFQNMITEWAKK